MLIWDAGMERTLILDEAETSVEWESEGGQNWHGILQSHWGQTGIATRIPETGVYTWPELQKEFPHNRGNMNENVKNLRKRLAWVHTSL